MHTHMPFFNVGYVLLQPWYVEPFVDHKVDITKNVVSFQNGVTFLFGNFPVLIVFTCTHARD